VLGDSRSRAAISATPKWVAQALAHQRLRPSQAAQERGGKRMERPGLPRPTIVERIGILDRQIAAVEAMPHVQKRNGSTFNASACQRMLDQAHQLPAGFQLADRLF
jgi:hypothetical protein